MRPTYPLLLFYFLIGSSSVFAQSQNENIIKVFEKVLLEKKAQWSKSNFTSMVFVPDAEMKKTLIFRQIKATSFDSISLYQTPQDKSRRFLYIFPTLVMNDAQQEDCDIISLNLNGEWIVRGLSVTKAGAKINIPLPHKENYLVMHAENLGSIPPNTAAMQLNDGTTTHQITLNSDAGKSEGIKFVRP